ncbi:MAG: hypothetical protein Q7S40_27040 [Opitutaceae bacterium]|nr:hypothetical protein [Opitutaceae bacterium]
MSAIEIPDTTCRALPVDPPTETAPRCIIVTGPRHADKTSWLNDTIRALRVNDPAARCAVLTAEDGTATVERLAKIAPPITTRRVYLPCPCCPAAADLPGHIRALVDVSQPDWLFIELPVLPASGLVGEFDAVLGWERVLVVCLDDRWAEARRLHRFSPFQASFIESANQVIEPRPVVRDSTAPSSQAGETPPTIVTLE